MPGQLTISLNLLNATQLAKDGGTAVVQAGSRLGQLYYNVRGGVPPLPVPVRAAVPRHEAGCT